MQSTQRKVIIEKLLSDMFGHYVNSLEQQSFEIYICLITICVNRAMPACNVCGLKYAMSIEIKDIFRSE